MQSGIVTCLGNQLDCSEHRSSPTDVRFRRLKRALEHAWSLRRLPGRIWEVILGHRTFLGLQERGRLSTFFTIYPCIRKNFYTSVPLWNSAREELVCFFGLDVCFCRVRGGSPAVQLLLPLMPAPLDMLCVLGKPQQKVVQHGRILERTRFKRNPGASARDSFFQTNDFVKGADGLWHPRTELDHPGVHSGHK